MIMMEECAGDLKAECGALQQLYYRNRSQHGNTSLFQVLHKVIKLVTDNYDWEFINDLDRTRALAQATIQKSSRICNERTYVQCDKLYSAYRNSLMAMDFCKLCHLEAQSYLDFKIFVPLSTFIIAAIARVYRHVHDLAKYVGDTYILLIEHFKVTTHYIC
jgi:hypothetical protein